MTDGLAAQAHIVGYGAFTPLGLDATQTLMLMRAGFAGMGPAALGEDGALITICKTDLGTELSDGARLTALLAPALEEACAMVGDHLSRLRCRILLCLEAPRAGSEYARDGLRELTDLCQRRVSNARLDVVQRGSAGSCFALTKAVTLLQQGQLDAVVLAGVHSDHDRAVIAELAEAGRLLDSENMDAVLPGEGAAVAILSSEAVLRQHRLTSLGRLLGVGKAVSPARADNDVPAAPARAATTAMREASSGLESARLRAGWVLTDVSFERWRLREWDSVFVRANNVLGAPYWVDALAHRLGNLGAAAGPLFVALACEGWRAGVAPAPLAVAFMASDTGERGTLCLGHAR